VARKSAENAMRDAKIEMERAKQAFGRPSVAASKKFKVGSKAFAKKEYEKAESLFNEAITLIKEPTKKVNSLLKL
jgi:hypothetical protein